MPGPFDEKETTNNTGRVVEKPETARQADQACLVVVAGPGFGETFRLKPDRTVIGRSEKADIKILDDGVSREHAAIEVEGANGRSMLVDLKARNGTFCNGMRVTRQVLKDGDKVSVGANTILKFTYQDELDQHFQRQLYESALRDGLTNTFNKRYFLDRLNSELKFAVRHSTAVALLFIDLDHFKRVNDNHGHQAGDHVLAEVSRLITATLRAEDVFARYGGEEFAVVCRGIDLGGAEMLARRLLDIIRNHTFRFGDKVIPVTISIGVAVDNKLVDPQALIAAADGAMYEAKRQGRNRACTHTPGPGLGAAPTGSS
ncbi:MAG TPA: GGDEF domain-containing protein [Polyangia bacterium]|nr:GGDEF domain-containing protein [Polyangia bacterium]